MWKKIQAWFVMVGMARASAELARQGYYNEAKNLMLEYSKVMLEYKKQQQTVKELSALTDRELNDIGISRGEIRSIAMGRSDNLRAA